MTWISPPKPNQARNPRRCACAAKGRAQVEQVQAALGVARQLHDLAAPRVDLTGGVGSPLAGEQACAELAFEGTPRFAAVRPRQAGDMVDAGAAQRKAVQEQALRQLVESGRGSYGAAKIERGAH